MQGSQMRASIEERNQLWDRYLETWPLERLRTMTLSEYTTAGDVNCLVYWVEVVTEPLGSIWGGSAFKSGIYSRKDTSTVADGEGRKYSAEYAWYAKYGNEPNEVFENVRDLIISIAEASVREDWSKIDVIDLGDAYKWKIAFLYQNRTNPQVVPIYKASLLRKALSSTEKNVSKLQKDIVAKNPGKNVFTIQDDVWALAQSEVSKKITANDVIQYLNESGVFKPTKAFTKYIAGFVGNSGRQIAVLLTNKNKATLFMSSGEWLDIARSLPGKITPYSEQSPRNSNLSSCTPKLAIGNAIVKIDVHTINDLQAICEAYEDVEIILESPTKDMRAMSIKNDNPPLNQILFGPPGTGKTYATIDEALKIIDPDFYVANQNDRDELKMRFDEAVEIGDISFVTFHQSFSYEDFIEGVGATSEDGLLRYEIKEGVFKQICDLARSKVTAYENSAIDYSQRKIWKMSLGNTLGEDSYIYDDCIKNNVALLGYGGNIDFTGCKSESDIYEKFQNAGSNVPPDSYAVKAVSTFILKVKRGDLIVVTDGNYKFRAIGEFAGEYENIPRIESGDHYTIGRKVNWLRAYSPSLPSHHLLEEHTIFSQRTIYQLRDSVISVKKLQALLGNEATVLSESQKPYVLIIDEINRGNISRIFGELITLIEPSKRDGNDEALKVTLPYSKHEFSVPNNVYLIGTMNTADRSLTGIDIALRRRFTFNEMMPRPELLADIKISGLNVSRMLSVMNERIEVLLDRDHCLGHTYFMPLRENQKIDGLASVFRQQIIPLLQEYFFEDWERISWVLNDHQKPKTQRFLITAAVGVMDLFGQEVAGRIQDRRWRLNESAFEDIHSYIGIIGEGT